MWQLSRPVTLILFGLLTAAPTALGHACSVDADCDNDDVCSVPDTCTAGTCTLGGGGDTDANLICDAEYDAGASMTLIRATLRKKTSPFGDNSSVRGAGDFILDDSAGGAFTAADGFSLRVKDVLSDAAPAGDGIDATMTWAAGGCTSNPARLAISCKSANGKSYLKLKQSLLTPSQVTFSFRMKGLGNLTGPFFGPVRAVLTHNTTVHRLDQIEDCRLTKTGLKCREF